MNRTSSAAFMRGSTLSYSRTHALASLGSSTVHFCLNFLERDWFGSKLSGADALCRRTTGMRGVDYPFRRRLCAEAQSAVSNCNKFSDAAWPAAPC
jgi:hypothetical protein